MTLTFRRDLSRPLTATEFDGNTDDLDGRLTTVEAAIAAGLSITRITPGSGSFTITFSDSSTQVIPLPNPRWYPAGTWTNSTHYQPGDVIVSPGSGWFLVLEDHTTDASPATFDANATDGTTENNPLYAQIANWVDTDYDICISLPGSQLYTVTTAGTVIAQIVVPRAIGMTAGLTGAYAYLGTPTAGAGTDPTTLTLALYKNSTEIGTIEFATGVNLGTFTFASDVDFAIGDLFIIRATRADDATAEDLSISIPAVRTDV